jgi:hypothetical protein
LGGRRLVLDERWLGCTGGGWAAREAAALRGRPAPEAAELRGRRAQEAAALRGEAAALHRGEVDADDGGAAGVHGCQGVF